TCAVATARRTIGSGGPPAFAQMANSEWRVANSFSSIRYSPPPIRSVVILETLGQLVDVLRRPARHFHAEMQTHLRQHFLDLVERLAAEVRGAEHFRLRLLHEVADVDDVVVLQAVCRTHRQLELVDLLEERRVEGEIGDYLLR